MIDAPKISVVMPVWNGEKYIRESIDSILNQTFTDFEFIIIDDGSTDQTIAIIESYEDPRIRLFKREHEGIVSALNFGVAQARADWIARQDADDIALPFRFERQMRVVQRTGAILCYGACRQIGDPAGGRPPYVARSKALLSFQMCMRCPIVHTSVLFSKTAFMQAGGYLEEERHAEDFGLWGRLMKQGDTAGLQKPIVLFREHAESISKQKAEAQEAVSRKIRFKHCASFLGLSGLDVAEVGDSLASAGSGTWLKYGVRYVQFQKKCNLEFLLWYLSQAVRRLLR